MALQLNQNRNLRLASIFQYFWYGKDRLLIALCGQLAGLVEICKADILAVLKNQRIFSLI